MTQQTSSFAGLHLLWRAAPSLCSGHLGLASVNQMLSLAVPLYSLQLLDRVLLSGSMPTLMMLSLGVVLAISMQAGLSWCQERACHDLVARAEKGLITPLKILAQSARQTKRVQEIEQQWRPAARILTSRTPVAVLEGIFWPFYALALAWIHPTLASVVCVSALAMLIVAQLGRRPASQKTGSSQDALQNAVQDAQGRDRTAPLTTAIRSLTQVALLAVGASLVMSHSLTVGGMIAASILGAKACGQMGGMITALPLLQGALQTLGTLCRSVRKPGRGVSEDAVGLKPSESV